MFSFFERDHTTVAPVSVDSDEELVHGQEIPLQMAFSTPEKLACYSSGRRLPTDLTQDVLLHETDFSFSFTIVGADLAFMNQHIIKYRPE